MAIRVALITPPLDASGGVGRMMSYVVGSLPGKDIEITLLDTRGHSPHPALSIFPLQLAWLRLIFLGVGRRVDVAHINMSSHGSTMRKTAMLWTCRACSIPTVLHLHSGYYPEFYTKARGHLKAFLRRTFATADLVIVLGSVWRDFVCNQLGVSPNKVIVLPNGAPGPALVRAPQSRERAPLRMLFLGRLCKPKGVPELLAALASTDVRGKRWTARLVGDGDLAAHRAEAERLGIADRVEFLDWVDAERAQQLLAESHLLLLPSHAEGMPMSLIEAFAHGLPAIATPVGAIPDFLEHGSNGLLVTPGDPTQLADAILTILRDEPLRLRLAANARRTWEQKLDIASYTRTLVSHWRHLSASDSKGSPPPSRSHGHP